MRQQVVQDSQVNGVLAEITAVTGVPVLRISRILKLAPRHDVPLFVCKRTTKLTSRGGGWDGKPRKRYMPPQSGAAPWFGANRLTGEASLRTLASTARACSCGPQSAHRRALGYDG